MDKSIFEIDCIEEKRAFADRLEEYRSTLSITQQQIAERWGISEQTYKKWVSYNNTTIPPVSTLIGICNEMNCDIDYLLGRSDVKSRTTQFIAETTGLSEKSIEYLLNSKKLLDENFNKRLEDALKLKKYIGTYIAYKDIQIIDKLIQSGSLLSALHSYLFKYEKIEDICFLNSKGETVSDENGDFCFWANTQYDTENSVSYIEVNGEKIDFQEIQLRRIQSELDKFRSKIKEVE